jgi:hypothetical protein
MPLDDIILALILDEPGTTKQALCDRFQLTRYRLHRALRHIDRDLEGRTLVHHDENGVWIVRSDSARCAGMDWMGRAEGGYVQCTGMPDFDDGCCYAHSQCENPEMTAFTRRLHSICGPAEPSAAGLSELGLHTLEELMGELKLISPLTLRDHQNKQRLLSLHVMALARRHHKEELRRRRSESRIPPEFAARHRASSINPFEFVVKKHFACLNLPTTATREEVLKAWRLLARLHHPDAPGGDEEVMKTINLAKEKIFKIRCWDLAPRRKDPK